MTTREFRLRLTKQARQAGISIPYTAAGRLEAYYQLLTRWNTKINLTALPLDPPSDATFERLLIEPLVAAQHVADEPLSWLDLGSGGGSPAIPMRILRPQAVLTLVESKTRKAAFLREVCRTLELEHVQVANRRFEELPASDPRVQLVTVRAVRPDAALFATAATLLAPGGRLFWFGVSADRKLPDIDHFRLLDIVPLLKKQSAPLAILERVFHVEH